MRRIAIITIRQKKKSEKDCLYDKTKKKKSETNCLYDQTKKEVGRVVFAIKQKKKKVRQCFLTRELAELHTEYVHS